MSAFEFHVEIEGLPPRTATEQTLRYATTGFVTGASDTPANTHYAGRVDQPIDISQSLFAEGATYGRSAITFGDVSVGNADAALDGLIQWAFDGRAVRVYRIARGAAFATRTLIFSGTTEHPEFTQDAVRFTLRDRQAEINRPFQSAVFAGTNSGGVGLEGTPSDIGGQRKPVLIGTARNLPVPSVNPAQLIYQISDAAIDTVSRVMDGGIDLTEDPAGDYASLAALQSLDPIANHYRVYKGGAGGGSFVRLGTSPVVSLTVDAAEYGLTPALATGAQLMQAMLLRLSNEQGNPTLYTLRAADVTAMDAQNSAVLGRWVSDDISIPALFDELANTLGAPWSLDQTGVFRLQRLDAPAEPVALTVDANDIVDGTFERVTVTDRDRGNPTWQQVIRYARNYAPSQQLSAGVTDERRAELTEWNTATFTDATVKTRHQLAVTASDDTWFTVAADAEAEAERRQMLRAKRRHLFQFRTPYTSDMAAMELGDTMGLLVPRYDLQLVGDAVGTPAVLLSKHPNARTGLTECLVWGATMTRANRVTTDGAYRISSDATLYRIIT